MLKTIAKKIIWGRDDPVSAAIKKGMTVGSGFSHTGNPNFGSEPYLITFEDNVRLSFDVVFVTHDGGTFAFRDLPEYEDVIKYGKIHVGERTFIGCRSIIMPGVTIGKRCVVAAGSVVTKSVPDGTVVAGVPAKPIMTTEEYAQKALASMPSYDKEAYMNNKRDYLLKWLSEN